MLEQKVWRSHLFCVHFYFGRIFYVRFLLFCLVHYISFGKTVFMHMVTDE